MPILYVKVNKFLKFEEMYIRVQTRAILIQSDLIIILIFKEPRKNK